MVNAAERSDVKVLEKRARIALAQNAEVLKGIMSNPFGRQWMLELLEMTFVGKTPYTPDPYATAFNCGQQNIGLRLLGELQTVCPDQYVLAMQEANERSINLDINLAKSRTANGHVDSDDQYSGTSNRVDNDYDYVPAGHD